ncbi:MAG: hypothetical protein C5B51_07220 [Terriglobia bacterium]|nr:MAG: hypothetical protein C5B51_07220 [Terriglobia bacterium]
MEQKEVADLLDLGAWIGRRQTFGVIAGRCSAAEANCLREIREAKKYRAFGLTWEEFCTRHAGISRRLADKIIHQWEQYGDVYFQLAGVTRITLEQFRLIARDVSADGLNYKGERIAIEPANAARLSAAVEDLVGQRTLPSSSGASKPAADCLQKAGQRLLAAVDELERLSAGGLETGDVLRLQTVVDRGRDRLELLQLSLRP